MKEYFAPDFGNFFSNPLRIRCSSESTLAYMSKIFPFIEPSVWFDLVHTCLFSRKKEAKCEEQSKWQSNKQSIPPLYPQSTFFDYVQHNQTSMHGEYSAEVIYHIYLINFLILLTAST